MRGGNKRGFIWWAMAIVVYVLTAALVMWSHLLETGYWIQARERVVDAALSADYSDAMWANAKTIEEAWPEVVKEQDVPFYYAQLQHAAELHDKVGYSDHPAQLKPYDELTRSERLLLARNVPAVAKDGSYYYRGPRDDFALLRALEVVLLRLAGPNPGTPTEELARSVTQTGTLFTAAGRKRTVTGTALRVGSPVSHAPLQLDKDFSPGNAYCELIDGEAIQRGVCEADDRCRDYHYPYEQERFHYLYFRIYGEKDIIAEGLWGWGRFRD